jgi:hypothetical protein
MIANCPYCSNVLDPAPRKKKQCPSCGSWIYVRHGELITETEVHIRDCLLLVQSIGITRDRIEAQLKSAETTVEDACWNLLETELAQTKDLHRRSSLNFALADLAEPLGKDRKSYQSQAVLDDLNQMKNEGTRRVVLRGANDESVCTACKRRSNRVFDIDELLKTTPLPMLCKTDIGCRCVYFPAID